MRANAVIMHQNKGHERHLQRYLYEEIGIPWHMIGFDTINEMGRGEFMDYVLDLDEQPPATHKPADFDDMVVQNAVVQEVAAQGDLANDVQEQPVAGQVGIEAAEKKVQQVKPSQISRTGKLCLSYSGDVLPCIFARQNWLGNIRDKTLMDMMDALDHRPNASASSERWQSCKESLTCSDCQVINYQLGNRIA